MKKIRVLVVDDSLLVQQMLTQMLDADPRIEVVGVAGDPYEAREQIKKLHPDVLTLDVEMPKMNGISFLKNLMRLHPMPVVMISTLTERGADITLQALEIGAVDFVTKPKVDLSNTLDKYEFEICRKVKQAAKVNSTSLAEQYQRHASNQTQKPRVESFATAKVMPKLSADAVIKKTAVPSKFPKTQQKIIALGASTGGTEAIKEVLMRLPADTPPIVISQHIPAAFSEPFAKRMDTVTPMTVLHAQQRQKLATGHVYIAPGDRHLIVEREGSQYFASLNDGAPVNRHKPSVDVMFRSVAQACGPNAVGILLTGMGADGAQGLLEIQQVGAHTIAQDKASSVVWGMPGEAVNLGAADQIVSLDKIPRTLLEVLTLMK
ncbi:chemotaxis response regulator protein-glutamate methylesterase [Thiomicrospira sp. ALE5]|uniref:protein-glutamate methylesterase/protein-glutamine glutaminase n=1 Tax=Thiomicrospira sp. ALE5 TaxID=748650 RepID=UPI0008F20EC8|nr:chemotaxis response regulator protein-glutamate methylesterase [Thiomicrospira sp. ALE5]SFR51694.1 two-component system, chemotaxis family, response regulator CheB [Thiomicrospira sp. ALE5]